MNKQWEKNETKKCFFGKRTIKFMKFYPDRSRKEEKTQIINIRKEGTSFTDTGYIKEK